MARHTAVVLVDDLTGNEGGDVGKLEFGLDGISYEIDLDESNSAALRKVLEPYRTAGRRTGGRRRAARTNPVAATAPARRPARRDPEQSRAIRDWGRRNGWPQLGTKGRIPGELEEAYAASR